MATHDHTSSPLRPALTDAQARQLPPLPKRIVYDGGPDRLRGFGLRVSPTARTWVLNYVTAGGRERRLVIGAFPTWNAKQARTRAAELRRLIDQGRDPLADWQAERDAPTIAEPLAEYEEAAGTKRSWRDDRAMIAAYIRPRWAARKVAEITADDVEALHREITRHAPIRANRVVAVVSALFRLAIKRRFVTANPYRGIERNRETQADALSHRARTGPAGRHARRLGRSGIGGSDPPLAPDRVPQIRIAGRDVGRVRP
jgi:hypothetical protein